MSGEDGLEQAYLFVAGQSGEKKFSYKRKILLDQAGIQPDYYWV